MKTARPIRRYEIIPLIVAAIVATAGAAIGAWEGSMMNADHSVVSTWPLAILGVVGIIVIAFGLWGRDRLVSAIGFLLAALAPSGLWWFTGLVCWIAVFYLVGSMAYSWCAIRQSSVASA